MPVFRRLVSTVQSLLRKDTLDRDLEAELESYIDLAADEQTRAGADPADARRRARLDLGGVEQVKERVRDTRLGSSLDILLQDCRYSLRSLRKNIGFTVVAVLVLAIGIGGTTALFSTVNAALLRAVPFEQPDRLVIGRKTRGDEQAGPVSRLDYFDYRERSRSFENLAALAGSSELTITGGDRPDLVRTTFVTWNLFSTLGVAPVLGRSFRSEEERTGGAAVAVISHSLWQRRYAGSAQAVGQVLRLNGTPLTIVGVLPAGFAFLFEAEVWGLVDRDGPIDEVRDSHSHTVVGRLKPGVSMAQAQSDVDAISVALEQQYPATNKGKGLRLIDFHAYLVSDIRPGLLLLMGTTVLVLLISCANVAGLLLARGQRRSTEMAMRTALGASKMRLLRQLLTESVVLTSLAGLVGIAVAYLLQELLVQVLPVGRPGIGSSDGIGTVPLLFALGVSVATGLLVGIMPALRATAVDISDQLKSGTRGLPGHPGTRFQSGLVVLQVAMSLTLLVGSGLLLHSLVEMAAVDPGFNADNLLTGQIRIQAADHPSPPQRAAFFESLLERTRRLPGVVSTATVSKMPILNRGQDWGVWPAEQVQPLPEDTPYAMARWVSPGYFRTVGIPLRRGRDIATTDAPGAPQVIVLSESCARQVFPSRDPLGRMLRVMFVDGEYEVVGIVADARVNELSREDPAFYLSAAQMNASALQLAVRTGRDPSALVEPIHQLLRRMDPNAVLSRPTTMRAVVDESLSGFRVVSLSAGLFAGLALLLVAIGLYGVLAYQVSQRSAEIGVRVALGASRRDVLGLVLKRGTALLVGGLLLGLFGSWTSARLIQRLLFQTGALDPAAYGSAVLLLAFVATMACLLPAWRAVRINPVEVLRKE
jgi:putative ABC transport system permease protein